MLIAARLLAGLLLPKTGCRALLLECDPVRPPTTNVREGIDGSQPTVSSDTSYAELLRSPSSIEIRARAPADRSLDIALARQDGPLLQRALRDSRDGHLDSAILLEHMRTYAVGVNVYSSDVKLDGDLDEASKTKELSHADKCIGAARTRGLAALVSGLIGGLWNPSLACGAGWFDVPSTRSNELGWVYDSGRVA